MGRAATHLKQNLIETAVELIWQNSYSSVSVDAICKAAGAKKGSFYYYFNSKSDLTLEAMEALYQRFKPVFDDIFSSNRDPIERFNLYIDIMYETQVEIAEKYGKVCGCPFASLGSEIAGQDENIRLKMEDVFGRKKEYFKTALADMITKKYLPKTTNIELLSNEIYAYMLGEIMIARIQNDLRSIRDNLKSNIFKMIGIDQDINIAA